MVIHIYSFIKERSGYIPSDLELARIHIDPEKQMEIESIDGALKEKLSALFSGTLYIREPAEDGITGFSHRYRQIGIEDENFIAEMLRQLRKYGICGIAEAAPGAS